MRKRLRRTAYCAITSNTLELSTEEFIPSKGLTPMGEARTLNNVGLKQIAMLLIVGRHDGYPGNVDESRESRIKASRGRIAAAEM